ncbi:MAG TPA: bifunctional phosphopantothenoylcysteine decarboxylase/phosphopantothenate--cysteine ligase CoaBC, partial [Acetivibrio sp.]|nr:bifunctional phosphopantothenoylcysteine decarboxylase/phosphopantothenate--cysteine ligase CoaBC [Acetivibrio sp.]
IVNYINDLLAKSKDYSDMKVLITAGPTREAIDPVRFITNPSSGKMGYAIAAAACERGASVRLISGPVNLEKPCGVETVYVTRAMEMYNEVMKVYKNYDVLIMVAAVADYRCAQIADRKIKKSDDNLTIELVRNPDIAAELGKVKGDRILVGFSAETDNLLKNASGKLISKNMDMIVANDVTMEGAGFGADTNVVKLIKRGGNIVDLPVMSKKDVAHRILDEILNIKNQNEIDRT